MSRISIVTPNLALANSSTVLRVIPSRMFAVVGGVISFPSRTMKKFCRAAFSDVAILVQDDGVIESFELSIRFDKRGVHVAAGDFGAWRERVVVVAAP